MMPANEPSHVTDKERDDTRAAHSGATVVTGSWRTLIQRFDGAEWVTTHEYPGDWALQWEAVAADERRRSQRLAERMAEARRILNDI